MEDLEKNLLLLKEIPEGKTTIGIHPCYANTFPSNSENFIKIASDFLENFP